MPNPVAINPTLISAGASPIFRVESISLLKILIACLLLYFALELIIIPIVPDVKQPNTYIPK